MIRIKIAKGFFKSANVAGTINSPASLAAALKLPAGALDLLELRLDGFAAETAALGALRKALPGLKAPLLVTARHHSEGALARLSDALRAELYREFLPFAALIDIELRSLGKLQPVVEEAQAAGVKVVGSFHDFKRTPRPKRLGELARLAAGSGVDVLKVATKTSSPEEVGWLLGLFKQSERAGLPLSVMGMGSLGKASRLLFAQAGSVINYGFLDPQAQVSGQWPAVLLKERLAELD